MIRPSLRALASRSEFDACVEIQKKIWRSRDLDLTSANQFLIGLETGGILLGAFLQGRLAGFVYSFPAVFRGKPCQHSHLLAVLPQHQGAGLGRVLKWAQRQEALKRGCDLITWTFDPLQVRNANLNLHSLGAVTQAYLPNFYGFTPALVFAPGLPSDRLKMEWRLSDPRLERRKRREWEIYDLERLPRAMEGRETGGVRRPGQVRRLPEAPLLLAEIPGDMRRVRSVPGLAAEWQSALRRALTQHFALGFRAADFILGERSYYVLEKVKKA